MNELDALITNMTNWITSTRLIVTLTLLTCVSVEIYMYYWSHTVESIKDSVFNPCHIISTVHQGCIVLTRRVNSK